MEQAFVKSLGLLCCVGVLAACASAAAEAPAVPATKISCPAGPGSDSSTPISKAMDAPSAKVTEANVVKAAEETGRMFSTTALTSGAELTRSQPTVSALMPVAEADKLLWTGTSLIASPERSVWVVTVHAPVRTRALPGETGVDKDVFSVAIDACSGATVAVGLGIDALK